MFEDDYAFVLQARVGTLDMSKILILTLQVIDSFCQAFQSGFSGARSAIVARLRGCTIVRVAEKNADRSDHSRLFQPIE